MVATRRSCNYEWDRWMYRWTLNKPLLHTYRYGYTHTHTTILRLCGFCPGQPGWAGTRRNILPLTLIVVINHPYLLFPSTTIHGILPIQSSCFTVFPQSLSKSSLVYLLAWHPPLHTPYISSPSHYLLFSIITAAVYLTVCCLQGGVYYAVPSSVPGVQHILYSVPVDSASDLLHGITDQPSTILHVRAIVCFCLTSWYASTHTARSQCLFNWLHLFWSYCR